ncbi:MAG TPA: hypothetical protein VFG19_00145 [Geobacteraceae bacterium]|nr:hypothetical protein [Geobacteraceae bacterium]
MNKMEKYLAAIEAAVETRDEKALAMLEAFATYVYQQIYTMSDNASGEECAVWDSMRKRAQSVIVGMSKLAPEIW